MRWLLAVVPLLSFAGESKSHFDYRREALAAYQRKDYAAARTATAAALALRPDSPQYLYSLAAMSARLGDSAAAFKALQQLVTLGVVMPIQRDPDFASLQGTPQFLRVLAQFAANAEPRGQAELLAELPGRIGIIEGIAFRERTGDVFLSDVHNRCIWRRERTGQITRFTEEDNELLGLFGLAIDEGRNALWATMAAVPEMAGYETDMKGLAGLVEFDLRTAEVRRVITVPLDGREHGLGDLLIAPNGRIYATDSLAPVVWTLVPDAEELQKAIDSPLFRSLQGMALQEQTLLVADHANGLFTIDLPTGNINALPPPKDTTLLGLDSILRVGDDLVAVQNGITPQRVLRIKLSSRWDTINEVTVLASGLPNFTDLGLATLVNDRPTLISGSGWEGFDPKQTRQPPTHTVRLFQVGVP